MVRLASVEAAVMDWYFYVQKQIQEVFFWVLVVFIVLLVGGITIDILKNKDDDRW